MTSDALLFWASPTEDFRELQQLKNNFVSLVEEPIPFVAFEALIK